MIERRQYAERDPESLGMYYICHIKAMTDEKLHAKSAIAAELAYRDREIDRLRSRLAHHDRLLALAVKWCDRHHQDWIEIKSIYDECCFVDLIESGGIAEAP